MEKKQIEYGCGRSEKQIMGDASNFLICIIGGFITLVLIAVFGG